MNRRLLFPWLSLAICAPLAAQDSDLAFFESKIRPVLASKCYGCHSSKLKSPMGSFRADTKAGIRSGGASGPGLVVGKPDESLLLKALSYTDTHLQMPPSGKLPEAVLADFRQWIAAGAVDPRAEIAGATAALKGMSVEDGKKWWAFQPLQTTSQNSIDAFLLAKLQAKGLGFSPPSDARTLVRRVYVDLVGYKPSYEEVEAFAADTKPDAYTRLIDQLLASPRYGEQWGRHWMDVARFGEDNPTGEATNPGYPYAWRYRDWIIDAINKDVPYDKFVKLQLAADLIPGTPREDLRALGYLGAAPVYHKDLRLSEQVIGGFFSDDLDERVDAVSRGLLGMTVACARCHDHKFDPIPTKDYYGLVGVFASTMRAQRPLFEVPPEVEQRFAWLQNRLFDLRYLANLLTGEASTVVGSEERVAKWKLEIEQLKTEALSYQEKYPKLVQNLERYWNFAPRPPAGAPADPAAAAAAAAAARARRQNQTSTEPFMNAVFEAAQYIDGSDPQVTIIHYKTGEPRDFPVLRSGNYASPGEVVPRHFPAVLAQSDPNFKNGSGRLELAEKIFTDSAPLAARIIVNRVWGWHFGKALVGTPSDFGVQGEKPTHPELLDNLAADFIRHGWSLKWLHREILMSQAYRQSSQPRAAGLQADPTNALLWRMNPRRLDVEAYRDTLLRSSERLDEKMYGPSEDVSAATNLRRTVYARVSRGRMSPLLKNYDFPDPMQTAGGRELTITPLQQLFVLNSAFVHEAAGALAASVAKETDQSAQLKALFRKILSREPTATELDRALTYLQGGSVEQYAQILLATNEEIFWP
ncbi:PSD1 and planctomycete cytochrome C domain-containing protein [Bryobacter aggregatus]|uniref:PSD1 and planctomycete cytochrome C domain-containing protein n=1 Tax=Bryobacter aggregatus TaxID=360054 RepID=UPI000691965F|nr:PSD1 and planctomycete cytochrome C domain-containing protein [Bryobacter aggregatus]